MAVAEGWPLVEVRLNKVIAEENVSVSWKLGRVSLFFKKKKYVIAVYLCCIKGESPPRKIPECKQMINED